MDNSGSLEVAELVASFNRMAAELDERISTINRQHNELQAVFASMVEAVIAVDLEERILNINPAAVSLLGITYRHAEGRKLLEAIRNQKLSRFVKSILQGVGSDVAESEIVLREEVSKERILQARGTVLRDPEGGKRGALVVFDDISQLRKLENIRRDFVANVSHELKTPVTTIKGFVETLLDGALKDEAQAREFLTVILRNVDRLSAIIDDLLMLSRLEQEDEKGELDLKQKALLPPLAAALDDCKLKAEEKGIILSIHCPEDLSALINGPLLEQAVVNLIINAIKYSESGKEVIVTARRTDGETVVEVRDFGIGIAREHLPRLFERFYRSDKARSRKLGGTGLGLAIVKHIVQAHGGLVEVDSMPGKGTVFTIRLPDDRSAFKKE
ncbi:MAG: ATP-binding protein [Deltaproteobacteria bacterium]